MGYSLLSNLNWERGFLSVVSCGQLTPRPPTLTTCPPKSHPLPSRGVVSGSGGESLDLGRWVFEALIDYPVWESNMSSQVESQRKSLLFLGFIQL